MRLALSIALAVMATSACSSTPRKVGRDGHAGDPKPVDAGAATREPGDPPLILACENGYFSGTAPMEIAVVKDGFVVASTRDEYLYLARLDGKGHVEAARYSGASDKLAVPHQGNTPPLVDADGHVHFTITNPQAKLVGVEVDDAARLVSNGVLFGGDSDSIARGAHTATRLLVQGTDRRGSKNLHDWREVLDLYDLASEKKLARIDPDCGSIQTIVATDWGFALACKKLAVEGSTPFSAKDYASSVVGLVDGKIAWRAALPSDVWWAALGTDGQTVIAIENLSVDPDKDDGRPYPVRAERFDAAGQPVGVAASGEGRIPAEDEPRLVWTGKEYAAIEWLGITRYDSQGHSLGTWRYEPDCSRRYDDVQLVWTGAAYAMCGWYRTLFDKNDAAHVDDCAGYQHGLPAYPALVYDPDEAARDAEIANQ